MSRRSFVVVLALAALAAFAPGAWAAGWIAFAAPDMAQTRGLYDELKRRAAPELQANGLELRFIPMAQGDEAKDDADMVRVVAEAPTLIVALSTRVALSAKRATSVVPVVFASVANPVGAGLVEELAHPGRNLTGFTYDVPVEAKQLELLTEIAPRARTIGVLEDGHWLDEKISAAELATHEQRIGRTLRTFSISSQDEIAKTILGAEGRKMDAWLVPISNTAANGRRELVEAIRKARKPAVYGRGLFVDAGGLAAYQEVVKDPVGLWLGMIRSILNGVPPSRIPVQRPKDFELSLNLAESKRTGIALSPALLRRANRVVLDE